MKLLYTLMMCAGFLTISGCHCLPCVERHNCRIDNISDYSTDCDGSAFSCLDVTRIGKCDGPSCFRCRCNNCR